MSGPPCERERLTMPQARRLGAAVRRGGKEFVLDGEVRSLVDESRPDGSWVCGTLVVAGVPVGFVGREVLGIEVGREVRVEGAWERHDRYGLQFTVSACRRSEIPRERRALVRYLAANVPDVREARAKTLVDVLGADGLVERLLADPTIARPHFRGAWGERVVLGLRAWQREMRSERWSLDWAPRLMAAGDISYSLARRVCAYFDGAEVADLIARRDPYRLLEVPGFGWKTADALARRLGVAVDDDARLEAAVVHAHETLTRQDGHSGVPVPTLVTEAVDLAGGHERGVRAAVVRAGIYGELVRSRGLVYRQEAVEHEWAIADLVDVLLQRRYPLAGDRERGVSAAIERANLRGNQPEAVRMALASGVSVLTGGAGTGKTHTLGTIVRAAREVLGLDVVIAAPTGKAAARAKAKTRHDAGTVHRLLGGPPGSRRAQGPLTSGLLILEEASMVDAEVMAWLAANVEPGPDFRLLVVGDAHQLPSVGPGRVLADLIASGVVPTTRLTRPERQKADSRILDQAYRVLAREPLIEGDTHDWTFVPLPADGDAAQAAVLTAVRRVVRQESTSILRADRGFDPRRELQLLTPRVGGALGVEALNPRLRAILNPDRAGAPEAGPWLAGSDRARIGDRLTCVQNDYTVKPEPLMNGEQGVVERIDGDAIHLVLDDGRRVVTRGVQNKSLALAFAATVHRAQGSEYPVTVLVFHREHGLLLDERVLYTGITRASDRLVLCCDPAALGIAAARGAELPRQSGLADRIRRTQERRAAHQSVA